MALELLRGAASAILAATGESQMASEITVFWQPH